MLQVGGVQRAVDVEGVNGVGEGEGVLVLFRLREGGRSARGKWEGSLRVEKGEIALSTLLSSLG